MDSTGMSHAGHERHLCYLQHIGYLAEHPESYAELVRGGRYLCSVCGRTAREADNLRHPRPLAPE